MKLQARLLSSIKLLSTWYNNPQPHNKCVSNIKEYITHQTLKRVMFKGAVKLFGVLLSICGLCPPSALVNCRFSKWLDALNIIARLALVSAYSATHLFTPGSISELKSCTYQVYRFLKKIYLLQQNIIK
jgi:hypothetical protein